MSLEVQAVYEDGVLKLSRPLPLGEHERVTIRVEPQGSHIRQTAGMVPAPNEQAAIDHLLRPDNQPWESR